MQKPFFSIIVVSLNPGERLKGTLESIQKQTFTDIEVILKDGGSSDGSLDELEKQGYFDNKTHIKVIRKKDCSIYDGMNQAVNCVQGKYVQFLNCGDYFYSDTVLEEVAECIESTKSEKLPMKIYYGNQYNQVQDTIIYSAPKINDFTCFRNVPCHQVCFYDSRLFQKRAYDLKYKVRADYEHFLYSYYEEGAEGISMPIIVASYEGGGFSETKENRRKSKEEHKEITQKYLGAAKVFRYRLVMWLTLAPIRAVIAENSALSGVYNAIKNGIYRVLRK